MTLLDYWPEKQENQYKIRNPRPKTRIINGAQYRVWSQVASLTLGARGPASPYSPFGLRPQTRIRLRLSNPNAGKVVCPLTGYI